MGRNWSIQYDALDALLDVTAPASKEVSPTTYKPVLAFDASTAEIAYFVGVLPLEYTGAGTLKANMIWMANATTGSALMNVYCEFLNPGTEAGDTDAHGATPDVGVLTAATTAYKLFNTVVTLTNAPSKSASDRFSLKIKRDATATGSPADDLAVDLLLLALEFYEVT